MGFTGYNYDDSVVSLKSGLGYYPVINLYPPQTLFVGGILFSRCLCVRPSVCASVRNALFP